MSHPRSKIQRMRSDDDHVVSHALDRFYDRHHLEMSESDRLWLATAALIARRGVELSDTDIARVSAIRASLAKRYHYG